MSTSDPSGAQGYPSEEELRAAYEAEIKQLRVEHVMLENIVTLVNLGMRRTGLMPGTEDERDPAQVQLAVESVRAMLPLLGASVGEEQVAQIREALSQLQMAYVQISGVVADSPAPARPTDSPAPAGPAGGGATSPAPPQSEAPRPGEAGPAQRAGRLWVPGQ
jgi:hypothetical protein